MNFTLGETPKITSTLFKYFSEYIERNGGIKVGEDKTYLIESRLLPILREYSCSDYQLLYEKVLTDKTGVLRDKIIDAMTTNETLWFRDGGPFEMILDFIFPELCKRPGQQAIRIWSAASSTGQEPYSLAMAIHEGNRKNPHIQPSRFEIVATDISPTVLAQAMNGSYDALSVSRGLSQTLRDKYFEPDGKNWKVIPNIKKMVQFKQLNLKDTFSQLGKFDLILCRNVLIYFSDALKKDIIERHARQLNAGGYYMIGASESLTNYTNQFVLKNYKNNIYYQLM